MLVGITLAVLSVVGIPWAVSLYRSGTVSPADHRRREGVFVLLLSFGCGVMAVLWLLNIVS